MARGARVGACGGFRRPATHRCDRLFVYILNMKKYFILDVWKKPETGQNVRFSRKPKKFSPNPYVLSSNPWLALIPTVGYDF